MTYTLETNRWQQIMALLDGKDGKSISTINHDIVMTYSHTSKVVEELHKRKIVKKEKVGREIHVILTKEGKIIAKCCKHIDEYLTRV